MNSNKTMQVPEAFVAIDFEHMYPQHETTCAIGMVKFIQGVPIQKFYSMIKPPQEFHTKGMCNENLIGIKECWLANAPTFCDLLPTIESFIANLPLIAHNAATEKACINKCCNYYRTESYLTSYSFIDTYCLTGRSLADSCEQYGIKQLEHHDALNDAIMCGELFLAINGSEAKRITPKEINTAHKNAIVPPHARLHPDKYIFPKELYNKQRDYISEPNFALAGKKIVITGEFCNYPNREVLKLKLFNSGVIINRSILKQTNILIVGENPGSSKIVQAQEEGISIISEQELEMMFDNASIEDPEINECKCPEALHTKSSTEHSNKDEIPVNLFGEPIISEF